MTLQTSNFKTYIMKINTFEEIIAWQKAKDLTIQIYSIFNESKDFGFRDQIQRASVSVMNNIAEGYETGTNRHFKHYLFTAKASCAEVRSMIILGFELGKLSKEQYDKLYSLSLEISRMISGLIKTL